MDDALRRMEEHVSDLERQLEEKSWQWEVSWCYFFLLFFLCYWHVFVCFHVLSTRRRVVESQCRGRALPLWMNLSIDCSSCILLGCKGGNRNTSTSFDCWSDSIFSLFCSDSKSTSFAWSKRVIWMRPVDCWWSRRMTIPSELRSCLNRLRGLTISSLEKCLHAVSWCVLWCITQRGLFAQLRPCVVTMLLVSHVGVSLTVRVQWRCL